MIFREFACQALLDWEMVSLGGALQDLGWWLFLDRWSSERFGLPRLDGLGSRAETIEWGKQETGRKATGVEWYELFATYPMQAIMMGATEIRGDTAYVADNPTMVVIRSLDL